VLLTIFVVLSGRVIEKFRESNLGKNRTLLFHPEPPLLSSERGTGANMRMGPTEVQVILPDLRGVGNTAFSNQATAGPLRSLFSPDLTIPSSVGYSQHSWNRILGVREFERLQGQKRNADDLGPSRRVKPFGISSNSVPCREGRSEPDVADFMNEHFCGPRAAGYPEDGTIQSDMQPSGENEFDKATRIFMASRFRRDMLLQTVKSDFELLSDFSRSYHEVTVYNFFLFFCFPYRFLFTIEIFP
jgi:hypothetical protein